MGQKQNVFQKQIYSIVRNPRVRIQSFVNLIKPVVKNTLQPMTRNPVKHNQKTLFPSQRRIFHNSTKSQFLFTMMLIEKYYNDYNDYDNPPPYFLIFCVCIYVFVVIFIIGGICELVGLVQKPKFTYVRTINSEGKVEYVKRLEED